jgi:hypothetical protein
MFKNLTILLVLTFLLGWLSSAFTSQLTLVQAEPFTAEQNTAQTAKSPVLSTAQSQAVAAPLPEADEGYTNREKASPSDRLKQSDVHVTNSRVVIDAVPGRVFESAVFTNTNSMDPLIDDGSQALQIVPLSESEIKVGDIISYDSGKYGIIIHRVINIGKDGDGWYAIVKGDNNPAPDPFKVRFNQIRRVLVGVLY